MGLSGFFAILAYACTGAFTPGPNNMMLIASGVNFGFKRTVPHILGIIIGFEFLVLGAGLGLGALIAQYPALQWGLKLGGGAYMLYLAWKIATATEMHRHKDHDEDAKPFTFMQAALFQWVNPKAWVVTVSALAMFLQPDAPYQSLAWALLAFLLASIGSTQVWAGFGSYVRHFLADPVRLKWFNRIMGGLLAVTILWMLWH